MPTLSAKLTDTFKSAPSPQRPFADQRGGQRKRNLKCFTDLLDALAGGDKVSLLRDFFSSREGRSLLEQLDLEPKDTSQRLMEALRLLHTSAPSRKIKRAVLGAVSPSSREPSYGRGGLGALLARLRGHEKERGLGYRYIRVFSLRCLMTSPRCLMDSLAPLPSAKQRASRSAFLKIIPGKQQTGQSH
jgi:hypothetical protein